MEKRKQAEIDAIHARHSAGAAYLLPKLKLPPRRRPTRLKCPVCKFPFAVKKRGPIPVTCGPRCALALDLHKAYLRGRNEVFDVLSVRPEGLRVF